VRHEVQKCALVQDNWINRMNHNTAPRRNVCSERRCKVHKKK
jgi:hypothetical protein